ncbi:MAG: hypothetical protein K8S54_09825, partial [Spirochaetia bacterium]|nr:hypothetical protein [Spirochaetia bacterium]
RIVEFNLKQTTKHFLAITALLLLAGPVIAPITDYFPADPGIKIIQIKDFVASGFSSFAARHPGEVLDAAHEFFPVCPPFAWNVSSQTYYVFPFLYTVFATPFYLISGSRGIAVSNVILFLCTLILLYKLATRLGLSSRRKHLMIWFLAAATSLPFIAWFPGEGHLGILGCLGGFYLLLLAAERSSYMLFLLSGIVAALAGLFRAETFLIPAAFSVAAFWFVLKRDGSIKSALLSSALFTLGTGLVVACFVATNIAVLSHPLGLRGIEFAQTMGSIGIGPRFANFPTYFLFSIKGPGLFGAWPILLWVFALRVKPDPAESPITRQIVLIMALVSLLYSLAIPLLVTIDDGSIFGPRYLLPIYPFVTLVAFYNLDRLWTGTPRWLRITSTVGIVYSFVLTLLVYGIFWAFGRAGETLNRKVESFVGTSPVLVYNASQFAYSASFRLFQTHKQPILGVRDPAAFGTVLQRLDETGSKCIAVVRTKAGVPDYAAHNRLLQGSNSFGEIIVDQVCLPHSR